MYNYALDTFLIVANAGSFSKAGEQLYISPGAVMKQINRLEDHLGVSLFVRSNHGLLLTEAGELIYLESQSMIHKSKSVIEKAKMLSNHNAITIRVGSSLMRPSQHLFHLWKQVTLPHDDIYLKVIAFDDEDKNYLNLLNHLGQDIDVICSIYPSTHFNHRCNVLHIGDVPICCGVPYSHPLSSKEVLEISDLDRQDLIMIYRGDTSYIDTVRDYLEQNHPQIHIINAKKYDLETMNYCNTSGSLMITASIWKDIHPSLVTIPVNWNYTVPYGVLYPLHPSQRVQRFVELLASVIK